MATIDALSGDHFPLTIKLCYIPIELLIFLLGFKLRVTSAIIIIFLKKIPVSEELYVSCLQQFEILTGHCCLASLSPFLADSLQQEASLDTQMVENMLYITSYLLHWVSIQKP